MQLSESLKVVQDAKNKIGDLKRIKDKAVVKKLNDVLNKNPGYEALFFFPKF